jgi:hypothetical protein
VDEEMGIYRGEVFAIMGALADVIAGVRQIIGLLDREDEDEEAEP